MNEWLLTVLWSCPRFATVLVNGSKCFIYFICVYVANFIAFTENIFCKLQTLQSFSNHHFLEKFHSLVCLHCIHISLSKRLETWNRDNQIDQSEHLVVPSLLVDNVERDWKLFCLSVFSCVTSSNTETTRYFCLSGWSLSCLESWETLTNNNYPYFNSRK